MKSTQVVNFYSNAKTQNDYVTWSGQDNIDVSKLNRTD